MSPESDNPFVKKLLEGYARLNGQSSTDGKTPATVGTDAHVRAQEEGEIRIKESAARRIGRNDPDSIHY